ncbi:MAG: murein biosynthesis integral membrane protein MurJ [Opitutaceae bacterium]|nr:murein biosynthesis integral membrane protein MurJ [Opitutaceae bacterium]
MGRALRNIGIVSGVTMASRVLGLGRDVAITAVFGASALASAFVTAFTLPNLFRRLLGEGALTAALVPTLQEETKARGEDGAHALVNQVATWTLLASGAITLAAMAVLAAHGWWAPRLEAAGWEAATVARWATGAGLGVVLFPYLVTVCLAAVFSAALQIRGRFLEPALNPVWLNLSMLGLLGVGVWGAAGDDAAARMRWLCAGVLLGGLLQMVVPALALRRLGWRPRFAAERSEGVRQIARLMVPTLFGSAIYLINTTVSRLLGLSLDDAAATVLNLSTRLMELPIGVFALAVSTVVFPQIARHAAEGRLDRLAEDYGKGMRLILLVNVPAAFGLAVLAEPITRVLFERGAFTARDTAVMGPVLAASALALPFLAFVSLTLRAFYALKDTGTPVRVALVSFVVNVVASVALMGSLGATGLAMAATLAVVVQAALLQVLLTRRVRGVRFRGLVPHLVKVSAASVLMALAVGAGWAGWSDATGDDAGAWQDLLGLALVLGAGVAVYGGAALALRVDGLAELLALARRKRGG